LPVLQVQNLKAVFDTKDGAAVAAQNVSFSIGRGETLGLVGESGCVKTITALAVLRLHPHPGRIESGAILFHDTDLVKLPEKELRRIRGNRISMVFQEPMTSLNPVFRVGTQLEEVLLHHKHMTKREARERSEEFLLHVGVPDPRRIMRAYPHQLSGGLRQRALIAMSLLCIPDLLIADEPTTAGDVTVQLQIVALLRTLKSEFGMAVLFISHDLSVVAESCETVAIMYASRIVEMAPSTSLFNAPLHPYTLGLLKSIPSRHPAGGRLPVIEGQVPRPTHYPRGCNFAPRCAFATEQCILHDPLLETVDDDRKVACWNWKQSVVV